jgi:hypothetical protein
MTLVTMLLLAVQFLLGSAVNLFVTITPDHPGANAPNYFAGVLQSVVWAIAHGPILLVLHAALGLLLVFSSIGVFVSAIRLRLRAQIIVAVLGWVGITSAGFNGGSFLVFGANYSSMLMSVGFAIAIAAYAVGLSLSASAESLQTGLVSQP